jgi:hypothetical protein
MNIFVLDTNPTLAAQLQCDKHVVKMIVETAQLLSTAHRMLDGTMVRKPNKNGRMLQVWQLDDNRDGILYKACHYNHPSGVWCRESDTNYQWLYDHFVALCDEYTHRYGKVHATYTKLVDALRAVPNNIPKQSLTPFKLAMGTNPECIDNSDPVGSYRSYYKTKKARFKMTWTNRNTPEWFNA